MCGAGVFISLILAAGTVEKNWWVSMIFILAIAALTKIGGLEHYKG